MAGVGKVCPAEEVGPGKVCPVAPVGTSEVCPQAAVDRYKIDPALPVSCGKAVPPPVTVDTCKIGPALAVSMGKGGPAVAAIGPLTAGTPAIGSAATSSARLGLMAGYCGHSRFGTACCWPSAWSIK